MRFRDWPVRWTRASCSFAVAVAAAVGAAPPVLATGMPDVGSTHRFFVSGHSLTDDPFAEEVAQIVASLGQRADWNQQIVIGSPISWRSYGDGSRAWGGYRLGKNRDHREGLNVAEEFVRAGRTEPYDTLILAEGHNTVAVIFWHDTVRYVRHFHERLIAGNPSGRTYVFESWESIRDKSDPAPWIALERAARPIWSCVARRVNASLAREGRADRVGSIPTGYALAQVIEAVAAGKVEGLSAGSPRAAVDLFLSDDVHLTPLGRYYVALVTAGAITGRPLDGAWRPRSVSVPQAAALQRVAGEVLAGYTRLDEGTDFADCRKRLTGGFCAAWNAYVPSKWVGPVPDCARYFARTTMRLEGFETPNPFVLPDRAEDAAYWFRSP